MSKEIGKEFWKLINRIWKEGIPGDWNKGMINPIHKKERDELKNQRNNPNEHGK